MRAKIPVWRVVDVDAREQCDNVPAAKRQTPDVASENLGNTVSRPQIDMAATLFSPILEVELTTRSIGT